MTGIIDDRNRYCQAWAMMMVEIWVEKANAYSIHHPGDLVKSFAYDVYSAAGGEVDKITHAFNYYGRFVDMGVGRGVKYGESAASNRKAKPWNSETYWRSVQVLTEKMAELYGEEFQSYVTHLFDTR